MTVISNKEGKGLGLLDSSISKYGGIVRWMADCINDAGDPNLFVSMAAPTYSDRLKNGIKGSPELTSGVGFTRDEARKSAVGEAVERYCGGYYDHDELLLSTWEQLGDKAVHPDKFTWFQPEQYDQPDFPFDPFRENTPVRWVEGYNLTKGKTTFVPAATVWEAYQPLNDEAFIWRGLTTGLSCSTTPEEAVLRGVLEIVERDSYSIMWYNRLSLPQLNSANNKRLQSILDKYFKPTYFDYKLVETTTTIGIPSAYAIMKAPNGRTIVGAAARPSLEEAALKAVTEVTQQWMGCRWLDENKLSLNLLPEDVTDFIVRPLYYSQTKNHAQTTFTYASNEIKDIPDGKWISEVNVSDELKNAVEKLRKHDLDVIIVDITTPEVREMDLHIYRVIIPGMIDITSSEKERVIGGKRIFSEPCKMGYRKTPNNYSGLNPFPHPLP